MTARRLSLFAGMIALVLTLSVNPVEAADFGLDSLQIHGFLSATYAKTDDNNWIGLKTESGSFDWLEAGINFTIEPTENLRIGLQLYSREAGPQGNEQVELDWAMADYRFRNWFGIRLGKVKMPIGLYNELRDADMARPSILLPQGIYPEALRDLINAYIGVGTYGVVDVGAESDLEYHLYYGTQDLDDSFVINRFVESGYAAGLNTLPMPLTGARYDIGQVNAEVESIYGGSLIWNTPVEGLRVGVTHTSSDVTIDSSATYSGWSGTIPVAFGVNTYTEWTQDWSRAYSIEYTRGPLLLASECWLQEVTVGNTLSGLPFPIPTLPKSTTKSLAYYGQAAYRFTPWLQLSAYYSEYFPDVDDKEGQNLALRGLPEYLAWSDELVLTARFDINRYWLFKIEIHHYDGAATVEPIENPDGIEPEWNLFLARATFQF